MELSSFEASVSGSSAVKLSVASPVWGGNRGMTADGRQSWVYVVMLRGCATNGAFAIINATASMARLFLMEVLSKGGQTRVGMFASESLVGPLTALWDQRIFFLSALFGASVDFEAFWRINSQAGGHGSLLLYFALLSGAIMGARMGTRLDLMSRFVLVTGSLLVLV